MSPICSLLPPPVSHVFSVTPPCNHECSCCCFSISQLLSLVAPVPLRQALSQEPLVHLDVGLGLVRGVALLPPSGGGGAIGRFREDATSLVAVGVLQKGQPEGVCMDHWGKNIFIASKVYFE